MYGKSKTIVLKQTKRGNFYDPRSKATLTRVPARMMTLGKRNTKRRNFGYGLMAAAAIASKKRKIFNTTLGQKLKKIKRSNNRIERTVGSTISRFLMTNSFGLLSPTDVGFNNAGYGVPLYWSGYVMRNYINPAINGTPAFDNRFMFHRFGGIVCFQPQLPMSKTCFFTSGVGAGNAYNQRFGLLPNYTEYPQTQGDNFNFNGVCFNQTYGFNQNTELANTIVERTNRLRVFKSWIRIELENPNGTTPMKVHILTCKLKCKNYTAGAQNDIEINLNELMKVRDSDFTYSGADSQTNTLLMRMYEDMRRGKLPGKHFTVLKHRQVYLGQKNVMALDPNGNPTLRFNNIKQSGSRKTISMAFGPKTIYRSHCSSASDVEYSSALMDEQWDKHIFCMMYTEPADFDVNLGVDADSPADTPTLLSVNYKIFKTNKWKGTNNVN